MEWRLGGVSYTVEWRLRGVSYTMEFNIQFFLTLFKTIQNSKNNLLVQLGGKSYTTELQLSGVRYTTERNGDSAVYFTPQNTYSAV